MNAKGTILIVDDLPGIRLLLQQLLLHLGFEVITADCGSDAMTKLEALRQSGTGNLRMIITDLHMPNMDGNELIRRVRAVDRKTPIIMLTTESAADLRTAGRRAGANGWVTKPIDVTSFVKVVARFAAV